MDKITLSPGIVAFICNDPNNSHMYKVIDEDVYYLSPSGIWDKIGEGYGQLSENGVFSVYFKPVVPVEYLTVTVTLSKPV